ncbi:MULTISPECIES: DUF6174 domain-containing protein [unclassified Streptomyces]|uniref:DUF6174 domain-containing protein n=1 Tax=unclassified Streptomyces TaxID=2593676 RepID=UPI0036E5CEF8
MIAIRRRPRFVSSAALAGLLCTTSACGSSRSAEPAETGEQTPTWAEPASYAYTLTSATQVPAGTFRVTVRDGTVTEAVGTDTDSRRQAQDLRDEVPTIGELLKRLNQARSDEAEAEYAYDGHPVRISLGWDENGIDDEALYVISAREPAAG